MGKNIKGRPEFSRMMGNIAKAHSKDKYTRYYYCKNTLGATDYKV